MRISDWSSDVCSSDLHVAILDDGGADRDGGVHVAVPAEVADGAAVDATLDRLDLVDDFHRADFRRAGQGAGGERRGQRVQRVETFLQAAGDRKSTRLNSSH